MSKSIQFAFAILIAISLQGSQVCSQDVDQALVVAGQNRTLVTASPNTTPDYPPSFSILQGKKLLAEQTFWDNRDWDWYLQNAPFFECPEKDIQTTYYYRWELMTKHLVYGSPVDGYIFTEFIDRPFWSGKYGAISCPAGHQLYEARWFRSPSVANDYVRYWYRTPGAQPRNYSCWIADGAWAVHQVHPDEVQLMNLYPDMVKNHDGWVKRHWVEEKGMFWQNGHDDGMEFNINSRQTVDILRGANGFRPTLNAYLWADALALAKIADLRGDTKEAESLRAQAARVKSQLQKVLWDKKREFFLQQFMRDEEKDGFKIKAGSLTHETGKFAGDQHGRELIGYVPWQFKMPDPGYESAWKFLGDDDFFQAPFGPTTVERHDPMFYLSKSCCFWSGQSWPYATAQTLKALANVVQDYPQQVVNANDYVKLLTTFAKSHRKNGKPYLAEALDPDTGSFEGHDGYNHSEHYFHSSYVDLVITGLVGLQTRDDDRLSLKPLAPESWDYFALDNLVYRGRNLAIFWDRDGTRYDQGSGFQVWVNGKRIHQSAKLQAIEIDLPKDSSVSKSVPRSVNVAVNNSISLYPVVTASSTENGTSPSKLIDGNAWYAKDPPNRWTSQFDSKAPTETLELDLGIDRTVEQIALFFLDDEGSTPIAAPASIQVEVKGSDGNWTPWKPKQAIDEIKGHRATWLEGEAIRFRWLRVSLKKQSGKAVGLTELQCWGTSQQSLDAPPPPKDNLAAKQPGKSFPKASASFTSPWDKIEEVNDGLYSYQPEPRNRWTCYQSKSKSDWVEIEFETPTKVSKATLHIFDDRGGVQAPKEIQIEAMIDGKWKKLETTRTDPEKPTGGRPNSFEFSSIETLKIRFVFVHQGEARSGVTEIELR